MSKKVLILTYYFPPSKVVAVYRVQAWTKDFPKQGIHTTVISRHWTGNEKGWQDSLLENGGEIKVEETMDSKIIYLPYSKSGFYKFCENKWVRRMGVSKLLQFFLTVSGHFQPELNARRCYKKFLFQHLKNNNYDLIIATSPPNNLIRLASEASKKFHIPFAIDFQDSLNNLMLARNYTPTWKEQFYDVCREIYSKRWLRGALLLTTVTPSIAELLKKVSNVPAEVITNGYAREAYNLVVESEAKYFNISLMGTVHTMQDITSMLNGLLLFLKDKDAKQVSVNFIGLDSIPAMAAIVRNALPAEFINVTNRVSMDEAVELTLKAHVLLFPSYAGYKDYYTAKIFEYLGARRNVLMIPGTNDKLQELIETTQAGKVANTSEDCCTLLQLWYEEWKNTGKLKYNGIPAQIDFYSREKQNEKMANLILNSIMQ